ncbi:hypothetical protein [Parvicella tangerina]|uniref:hypothetical protein n=1 Tax=Parvicella tangerina TaxID=2829795 RepID=UPI00215BAC53|nr:hypothetical protein [Parvicella tangerina]
MNPAPIKSCHIERSTETLLEYAAEIPHSFEYFTSKHHSHVIYKEIVFTTHYRFRSLIIVYTAKTKKVHKKGLPNFC